MDLQALSLALPSITKELRLSNVSAGALGTHTLVGRGLGGAIAGRLADRFGRVGVVWWSVLVFTLCTCDPQELWTRAAHAACRSRRYS